MKAWLYIIRAKKGLDWSRPSLGSLLFAKLTQNIICCLGGGTQYKRLCRDVLPTWVAKSASWYMNRPYKMQNLVHEWANFSKFPQIWVKISSNLRKFWKNWVILLKTWPKIAPIGMDVNLKATDAMASGALWLGLSAPTFHRILYIYIFTTWCTSCLRCPCVLAFKWGSLKIYNSSPA